MEQDAKKQLYEIVFLANPSMLEEEARDFHQKLKNEATALGALIEDEGRTEKIHLSYPIKKQMEANLGSFKFTMDPSKTDKLNSKIKSDNQILRLLCVKTVRPPERQISTKPFAAPQTFFASRTPKEIKKAVRPASEEEPAANVEEIDKKLEEILGK